MKIDRNELELHGGGSGGDRSRINAFWLVDLLLAVSHLGLLGRPNSGFRLHWFEKIGTWRIGRRGRGGEGKTTLEREVRLFPMVLTMVSSS